MDEPGKDLDLGGGAAAPDPAEDPLAGVPSEPIQDVSEAPEEERLGGDGAAIGEEAVEEPAPGEFMEEPEEAEEPEPEPQAEEPAEEPAAEEPPAAPAAEEPEPEPEPPAKPKAKAAKPKTPKTPPREYKILRLVQGGIESPLDKPVKARNGDDAIKEAYKALAKSADETMTLVAIPVGYFKPKEVKGREKKDYAVEIN